jgi:hypothetical protein
MLRRARCRPEGSTEKERVALATDMHAMEGTVCFLRGLFRGNNGSIFLGV